MKSKHYRLQILMKNKQSNSKFNVMYNWELDDCTDPASVSSVSIIVAPGLRSKKSAVNIDFLRILKKKNIIT